MPVQHYWAIYRQPKTGNAGPSVQASTNIAPAGSTRRTPETDDRTRAPVCEKRPGHVETVGGTRFHSSVHPAAQ